MVLGKIVESYKDVIQRDLVFKVGEVGAETREVRL